VGLFDTTTITQNARWGVGIGTGSLAKFAGTPAINGNSGGDVVCHALSALTARFDLVPRPPGFNTNCPQ
jgi:hypothetical protein